MGALGNNVCPRRPGGEAHESHESREALMSSSSGSGGGGGGSGGSKKVLKDCGSSRFSEEDWKRIAAIHSRSRLISSWLSNSARIVLTIGLACVLLALGFFCGSGMILTRANVLGRQCHAPNAGISQQQQQQQLKFAMVSCSDGSSRIPQRSFQGLMELVTPNKQAYVDLHGYDFIDASDCLDSSRPPSWSKIVAVRKHLPNYDWVFWNDADSVVTNPAIALEDIINSVVEPGAETPDFIVTEDVTGVNAGMFFFRNSEWSHRFLETWWNQTSFIKPFGQCKSGDNDALKFLVKTMHPADKRAHVRIAPMQCMFNSNPWMPSWKNSHRLVTWTWSIWQGVYSEGDFMVHLAGMGDKKTWIRKILKDLQQQRQQQQQQQQQIEAPSSSSGGRRAGPP